MSFYVGGVDPPTDPREADLRSSTRSTTTCARPATCHHLAAVVGDFLEVYEPLIEEGADIVSLHLSGGISGTVRSAEQARDQLVERGRRPSGSRSSTPRRCARDSA